MPKIEERPLRMCRVCGVEFAPKTKNHVTCSKPCRRIDNIRRSSENQKTKRIGPGLVICKWCGKEFLAKHPTKAKFCCSRCKYMSDLQSVKNGRLRQSKPNPNPYSQPCWKCQHASDKHGTICQWALDFEPVPGWDAEPVPADITPAVLNEDGTIKTEAVVKKLASWKIKSCPLFKEDVKKHG